MRTKRIISFMLVMCMMLSLTPVFPVSADENTSFQFIYNFVGIDGYSRKDVIETSSVDFGKTKGTWEFSGMSGFDKVTHMGNHLQIQDTSVGSYFAVKISVPCADTYTAKLDFLQNGVASGIEVKGDVYLFEEGTELGSIADIAEDKKIGNIGTDVAFSAVNDAENPVASITSEDIYIPAGEHVLVFYITSSNGSSSSARRLRLSSLTLTSGDSNEYAQVPMYINEAAVADGELEVGESIDITFSGWLSDGSVFNASSDTVSFESKNGNVSIKNGVVTGKSAGEDVITATVIVGGISLSKDFTVKVVEPAVVPDYELIYDFLKVDDFASGSLMTSQNANFDTTGNMWALHMMGGIDGDTVTYKADHIEVRTTTAGSYFAVKINVPERDTYIARVNYLENGTSKDVKVIGDIYLLDGDADLSDVSAAIADKKIGNVATDVIFAQKSNINTARITDAVKIKVPAGESILVFYIKNSTASGSSDRRIRLRSLTLTNALNPIVGMQTQTQAVSVGDTIAIDKTIVKWEDGFSHFADDCTMSYVNKTPDIISVTDEGVATAIGNGVGKVDVTVKWDSYELTSEFVVVVGTGKTRRSFYTDEKLRNLKNNIARYDWAQDERDTYIDEADKILAHGIDTLYSMITTQELPRATSMAYRFGDNGAHECLYCEKDLYTQYGDRPWDTDVFGRPWKIQCPDCKRLFPSNDFGKFYELGIDEHGNYRFALALQRHHEKFVCKDGENCECPAPAGERGSEEWNAYYGYGVKGGYLCNDTYGERNDPLFAVDDGWGYEFTYTYKNADGTPELNEDGSVKTELRCKPYIAWYNDWGLMYTEVQSWIENLSMAYLYTDDAKYGRAAAILVDRIADLYPEFDTTECGNVFDLNDGGTKKETDGESRGRIFGNIHDTRWIRPIILAYDAVFPLLSDSEVISFLSEKAEEFNLDNPKTSAADISMNIENGILREVDKSIRDYRIRDNFGSPQRTHLYAAVILDTFPETGEWIDFVFQSGGKQSIYEYTGGEVYSTLINTIDRDGHGTEAAPGYNYIWVENLMLIADSLNGYDKAADDNLYEHPKLIRSLMSLLDVEMVSNAAPNIGDHDRMGRHMSGIGCIAIGNLITIYNRIEDEEAKANIARVIYRENGNTTEGLHGSIFDAEPEAVIDAIEDAVADGMEIKLPSRMLSGYGISMLRDGDWFNSTDTSKNVNTQRDFYLWYGNTSGHGDYDKLNLGFHAFGLDVGSDIGEAAIKDNSDPHRFEMQEVTQSHNTVTVNNVSQKATLDGNVEHFDDAGRVRIMDAEAPEVYAEQGVEEYKRTLVMVDANDDISYGVDFFHIVGGDDHLYSFHALSTEGSLSENVEIQSQKDENGNYIGSYQGIDKKWGGSTVKDDSDGLGTYSWFGEVDRATDPASADVFSMDWKIVDNDKVLKPAQNNLRVRLTMLNSFKLDEITTTSGIPPQVYNALPKARFLFARHTGENDGRSEGEKLDTLFTSVVEPYNKTRYISNIEKVNVARADGEEFTMDEAKAVKVTLTNGRVDYIVYAKDTSVPYKVFYSETESFDFCGYIGVVSMVNGEITYTYVNDGTTIADKTDLLPAHKGEVTGFQTDLSVNNWMDIDFDGDVAPEALAGKYIYVDNGLTDNAAYLIESAAPSPDIDGSTRLYLGNTTLITSYVDDYNFDKGYNYNIKVTDKARIPLSYVDDTAPVFEPISNSLTTSAGSSISVPLKATSEHGAVTYSSVTLPRGASLNSDTGVITWKPDASQVGENLVQVDAVDVYGRVTRANFTVTVYGSTTGTSGEGTSSDGGGGGGGSSGQGSTDGSNTDTSDKTDTETTQPDASGETDNIRFTDLGNHAWAADAINSLAADGIVKGTTATTYSPGANITRADFALLLVRAFNLTSDNAENFADVSASDYFAPELAVARNTGIINGIGDNKYAPRNSITRQDMMVIVYRAIKPSLPKGGGTAEWRWEDSPASVRPSDTDQKPSPVGEGGPLAVDEALLSERYGDWDTVAPYARDAVSCLIFAGLVNGKSGLIAPTDYTTRAEVAVLLKRILDYTK